ncbi:hypothetical protein [Pseudidiomarina sp. CB1]|uniref:hypothetical protein n=1 Tax=Pseudidiomarina sp. CB1 TaxID=2972484 RepID=UPI0021630651|nr:hypothetical protein [Pseudidiomarina sp. CB1]
MKKLTLLIIAMIVSPLCHAENTEETWVFAGLTDSSWRISYKEDNFELVLFRQYSEDQEYDYFALLTNHPNLRHQEELSVVIDSRFSEDKIERTEGSTNIDESGYSLYLIDNSLVNDLAMASYVSFTYEGIVFEFPTDGLNMAISGAVVTINNALADESMPNANKIFACRAEKSFSQLAYISKVSGMTRSDVISRAMRLLDRNHSFYTDSFPRKEAEERLQHYVDNLYALSPKLSDKEYIIKSLQSAYFNICLADEDEKEPKELGLTELKSKSLALLSRQFTFVLLESSAGKNSMKLSEIGSSALALSSCMLNNLESGLSEEVYLQYMTELVDTGYPSLAWVNVDESTPLTESSLNISRSSFARCASGMLSDYVETFPE